MPSEIKGGDRLLGKNTNLSGPKNSENTAVMVTICVQVEKVIPEPVRQGRKIRVILAFTDIDDAFKHS